MAEDAPSRLDPIERSDHPNLPAPMPRHEQELGDDGDSWLHRLVRTLFRRASGSTRSNIEMLLHSRALDDSGFSPEQRAMLNNILGLSERRVEDVMVPRADIIAVHQEIPLGELLKVFENAGHSRLVVYNDALDDPVGLVHIRDLIACMTAQAAPAPQSKLRRKKPFPADLDLAAINLAMPLSQANIIRTILFVPPSMPTLDLLAKMQATRIHLALVIDEYGGTDGLVSLEDLVEQIVGDIEDEHDEASTHLVVPQPDGSFVADARATLDDVIGTIGSEFDVGEFGEDVDTVGGYLVTRIGRVPVRGEIVPGPEPFEVEVLDADPRRVKKVKISRSRQPLRGRESRRDSDAEGGAGERGNRTPEPPAPETPGQAPATLPTPTRQP